MHQIAYSLFTTPIGPCAIAWGPSGIVGVQLPQRDESATRGRIERRFPTAKEAEPDGPARKVIVAIGDLLSGGKDDLRWAPLDLTDVADFNRAAYALARSVPPGATITYGEIAARMGDPAAARAVGRAMGANPFPIIVPCHRVLGADGKMGGFSADGGIVTKARLLSIERARLDDAPLLFDELPISIRPPPKVARRPPVQST